VGTLDAFDFTVFLQSRLRHPDAGRDSNGGSQRRDRAVAQPETKGKVLVAELSVA
jgi:hypothetical protein